MTDNHDALRLALNDKLCEEIERLTAQRDALLASLRVAVDSDLGRAWVWPDTAREQWMRDARAAIKAVEEGK